MEQEEEEIERNINNIACKISFESPVTMNKRLAVGILSEMVKYFRRCTIQSDE